MRFRRPRYTIFSLMIAVLVVSLVLAIFIGWRDYRRRRAILTAEIARAEAEYRNAQLTHEVAQIAVVEYGEGIFKQDLETVEAEIVQAQNDLRESQAKRADAIRRRNRAMGSEPVPAESENQPQKAKLRLERAQERKTRLTTAIKDRRLKELNSEVAKAKSDEAARKQVLDQLKLEELKATRIGPF